MNLEKNGLHLVAAVGKYPQVRRSFGAHWVQSEIALERFPMAFA
jgi:hypothetical protein